MTLNVQNTTAGDPRRVQLLNDAIRRVAPDVISLQEVMSTDHLDAVLDGTGLNGTHQSEVLGYEPPFVDKYGGTAVATRWPHRIVETLDQRLTDAPDVPWWCTLAAVVAESDDGIWANDHFGVTADVEFDCGH